MDHWEGAVNLSHGTEHRLPADLSPRSSMSWRPHTVLRHLSPVKGQDLGGQGGMGTRVTDGGAAGPGVTQSPLCSDRPGVAAGGVAVPLLPRSAAGVAPAVLLMCRAGPFIRRLEKPVAAPPSRPRQGCKPQPVSGAYLGPRVWPQGRQVSKGARDVLCRRDPGVPAVWEEGGPAAAPAGWSLQAVI